MKIINNNKILSHIIIPILLYIILVFNYSNYEKILPISFYDEFLWVGRSYFFDHYIKVDYTNEIWQTYESYDQPKLTELIFGAWIYPRYLKSNNKSNFTNYILSHNLYSIDEKLDYNFNKNRIKFSVWDQGLSNYYQNKYGEESIKTIDLIRHD